MMATTAATADNNYSELPSADPKSSHASTV